MSKSRPVSSLPRLPALVLLLGTLSLQGCTGGGDGQDGTALVGNGGGVVVVRGGPLAGTALEVPTGAVQAGTVIRIGPATAAAVDGFVAVGPAARIAPEDLELDLPATVTLRVDGNHPQVVGSDPGEDLVVLRLDHEGFLHTLPWSRLDLALGVALAETSGLGTFWVAVRPSAEAFLLEPFLPLVGDWFSFDSGVDLLARDASGEPNLGGAPWTTWDWIRPVLPGSNPIIPGPVTFPHYGLYLMPQGDGSTRLGGWLVRGSGLIFREQILAVDPLALPSRVTEDDVFERAVDLDRYQPFGSTTPLRTTGVLRVTFGRRLAVATPAGAFGDVLDATFEIEVDGSLYGRLRVGLARGVGPVTIEEVPAIGSGPGALVWAMAGGRIFE